MLKVLRRSDQQDTLDQRSIIVGKTNQKKLCGVLKSLFFLFFLKKAHVSSPCSSASYHLQRFFQSDPSLQGFSLRARVWSRTVLMSLKTPCWVSKSERSKWMSRVICFHSAFSDVAPPTSSMVWSSSDSDGRSLKVLSSRPGASREKRRTKCGRGQYPPRWLVCPALGGASPDVVWLLFERFLFWLTSDSFMPAQRWQELVTAHTHTDTHTYVQYTHSVRTGAISHSTASHNDFLCSVPSLTFTQQHVKAKCVTVWVQS